MIALLSLAFAGSEVLVEATAECRIEVDGRAETLKARKSGKFKVDEGQVRISVSDQWVGTLDLPNRVEVRLDCDGTSVALVGAENMGPAGAGLARTAMGVAAGAAAVNDAAGAMGEAGQDMKAVSNGQAPPSGSSRTEVTMSAGPGGFASSTSRTTAGPGGVQHDSSSTSVGPDGISRSRASGTVNGSGASFEERSVSASIQLPSKGGTVSLTRTGGSAVTPSATVAGNPPAAPTPVEDPPPKEVTFTTAGTLTDADFTAEIRDPVGNEGETKLNIKVSATDSFVVYDTNATELETPRGKVIPKGDKRVVLAPGKAKGTTLVYPGDYRARELRLHLGGLQRVQRADPLPIASSALDSGTTTAVGPASCAVDKAKVSSKEAKFTLKCTADAPVIIDTAALGATAGPARVDNAARNASAELLWPGETTRLDLVFPSPPEGAALDWTAAAFRATATDVVFDPVVMTATW